MRISQNFSLAEFLSSDLAARRGYHIIADQWTAEQINRLVLEVLQPIRDDIGAPIVINSGYRPAWLNAWIGGAKNSAHLYGLAADCKAVGITVPMLFERIKRMDALPIDQLINEFDAWIHISIAPPGKAPRGEYLVAEKIGGRTQYRTA